LENWDGAGKVSSGKLAFKQGDFLFGKLRPYFHKVGIAPIDGICSTDIAVLNAKTRESRSFVISSISEQSFVTYADRTSDGTKMPRTSWAKMEKYGLCIPADQAIQAYDQTTGPLFERIVDNIKESKSLALTRDLLLPRLLSGDVRVKDAEKTIGESI
jgi:type I restriction enzyme S subunit